MKNIINLSDIYLGRDVAEEESKKLHDYFISTKAYLNSKNERRKKTYFVGHRGAGKSALFSQLAHEYRFDQTNIVLFLKPAEYSYDSFTSLKHDFHDVKASYSVAWHYTLMVQIFISVVSHFESIGFPKKQFESIKSIQSFLINKDYKEENGNVSIFLSFLRKIKLSRIELSFKDMKLDLDTQGRVKKMNSLLKLDEIKKPLGELRIILNKYKVYVFIDELDTGWNNTKEAKNFLHGLFYSVNKVNEMDNVNVLLSIRQDMYNNLAEFYSDTEKIRGNIEILKWDNSTLKSMLRSRICDNTSVKLVFGGRLNSMNTKDVLELVFEKEELVDYILKFTLGRPRELLFLCNLLLEEYAVHKHIGYRNLSASDVTDTRITKSLIDSSLYDYSRSRYQDFTKEYSHEFSKIKDFLEKFDGNVKIYNYGAFIDKLEISALEFAEIHIADKWILSYLNSLDKLLEVLFRIGFIKVSYKGSDEFFTIRDKQPNNFTNLQYVSINDVFAVALHCT